MISPEVISHPYPLAPKYPRTNPEARFRPHMNTSGPYRQLESPTFPHNHAHSKTVSESTTSTGAAPQPQLQNPEAIDGLGLGMRYGIGEVRGPDRAYVLADRNSTMRSVGKGTSSGGGGGRKLKKTRLVEGDWELVRTDFEDLEKRSKRSSRIGRGAEQQREEDDKRTGDDIWTQNSTP